MSSTYSAGNGDSAEDLRAIGWERIRAAYARPDAVTAVREGAWAGFSRADATAWCWNLFQYEPHGFVHPGSEVRVRATSALVAGGLPEVFGYPERARRLAESGLTPPRYRQHREALGAPIFREADVTHSPILR